MRWPEEPDTAGVFSAVVPGSARLLEAEGAIACQLIADPHWSSKSHQEFRLAPPLTSWSWHTAHIAKSARVYVALGLGYSDSPSVNDRL